MRPVHRLGPVVTGGEQVLVQLPVQAQHLTMD